MKKSIFGAFCALAACVLPISEASALQCVPFARAESGIDIRGNAKTWWNQAAGRYQRGNKPVAGAVVSFRGTRAMPMGHVAVVKQIVSDRELLIDHANWSLINGRRGQIERNVKMVDVSPNNDWSVVKVWYAPIRALGLRTNAVDGFIYSGRAGDVQLASTTPAETPRQIAMR